jgi:MFS family permease
VVLFAFNVFLVSTALPSAVTELGGGQFMAWATSLYLIPAIIAGTSAAAIVQRLGARFTFIAAALAFMAGTLVAGFAPSMPVLLGGRALQGTAAGLIEATSYMLIPRLFPSRLVPKIFGAEAIAWALSAFAGPALAGYLTEVLSWRAAFLSALPLGIAFLALVPMVVPRHVPETERPLFPWTRLTGVACGMALFTFADAVPGVAGKLAAMILGAGVFYWIFRIDGQSQRRLFPPGAFGFRSAQGLGFWTALLMPLSQASTSVFLVYALQFAWHESPLVAGLVASVMALSWSGAQFIISTFGTRWPKPWLIRWGAALLVIGLLNLVWALNIHSLVLVVLAQIAIGTAFGMTWGALSQVMMEGAAPAERDATSGLLPTVQAAGYGIGAAIFGLAANFMGFSLVSGQALIVVMSGIFLGAAAVALAAWLAAMAMVSRLGRQSGAIAPPNAA